MPTFAQRAAHAFAARGYDLPKFRIGLWMVLTAYLALIAAWALGLSNPQWAALTVLVTIQPSRGQTLEKTLYRFLGTLIGSAVGLGVLLASAGDGYKSAHGLALWAGLCVTFATVNRSYRSYGIVLAGYSAIIVALNNYGPPDMVIEVALIRVACILVGLGAGVLMMALVLPHLDWRGYEVRTRRILAQLLQQASMNLRQPRFDKSKQDYTLVVEAAQHSALLVSLSAHRAGFCPTTGPLNDLMICGTNLLMASQRTGEHPVLADELASIAQKLRAQGDFTGLQRRLNRALVLADEPMVEDALLTLAAAVPDEAGEERGQVLVRRETEMQSDWRGARREGFRIAIVMAAIGCAGAFTGQSLFNFAMISAAIVMSIASLGVSPVRKMQIVMIGQLIAAVSAVICEKVFWTTGMSGLGQVLLMGPSLLIYAFLYGHGTGARYSTDYCLALLMLLAPTAAPYAESFSPYGKAVMVVGGGIVGYIAFRWIFPTDATKKRKRVWRMIKAELRAMADAGPMAKGSAHAWRLRFIARYLRIADWSYQEVRGEPGALTLRKGLLTLALADLVFALRRMLRMADLPVSARRSMAVTLKRIVQSDRESPELARAFAHMRAILGRWSAEDAQVEADRLQILQLCEEMDHQLADLGQQRYAKVQASLSAR